MNPVEPTPWYQSRTVLAAIATMVLAVLDYAGVSVEGFPLDKVLDGLLALSGILVLYWRLEPSAPKPLNQGQTDALTRMAKGICGPNGGKGGAR